MIDSFRFVWNKSLTAQRSDKPTSSTRHSHFWRISELQHKRIPPKYIPAARRFLQGRRCADLAFAPGFERSGSPRPERHECLYLTTQSHGQELQQTNRLALDIRG